MKQESAVDYSFLANYCFSISLALWSVPSLAFAQPFLNKASLAELLSSSTERLVILTIIIIFAIAVAALGFYFAPIGKRIK